MFKAGTPAFPFLQQRGICDTLFVRKQKTYEEERMNDWYSELLVKIEQTGKDKVIKFLLIGLIAATAVVCLRIPLVWGLTLGPGIAAYFFLPNLDLEYE